MLKRKFLVGAVVLLAVAGAGGAYAATRSGGNSRQAFTNDLAKRLNVSPAKLRAAVKGALLDRLQAAVRSGQLTQAQADRMKQRIEQGGGIPFRGLGPHGFGLGPHAFGFGVPRGFPPPPGPGGRGPLAGAAKYLGVSEAQLMSDLRSGKTLAQVAKARGKSVAGLEQALVSDIKSRLDRLATRGFMTKAQEQRILKRLSSRMAHLVYRAQLGRRPVGGPPGGPGLAPPAPGGPPPAGPARGPALAPAPPGA